MEIHFTKTLITATSLVLLAMLVPAQPAFSASNSSQAAIDKKVDAAATAYQAGRYDDAAKLFREVVKLEPAHAQAWLYLGLSFVKTNDVMGARRALGKAVELQPSGKVAERAREALAKLPEPDLYTLQLDSGLTLGDWLPLAEKQSAQGKRDAVLREIAQYLNKFGPVPQLQALQERLVKEAQAEREQQMRQAIASIKVHDAQTAKEALPKIRQLKTQDSSNLTILGLEAKACHLLKDFACAEAAYAAWLKSAPGNDARRARMVALLMQAKQHEALPAGVQSTGQVIRDCPDCPEMVVLSAGSFEMGQTNDKHTVTFAKPFAIGKTEVTQGQWKALMGSNPSEFKNCGDNCPVENVSWNDVQEFIQKLNAKTGKQYRLPSEAEWEAACRGGEEQEYCGSDDINSVAWYGAYASPAGNSAKTTNPVATKQANAFGLYDMSGNVWEWVEDSYHDSYSGAPTDGTVWQGDGAKRVLRGGSWSYGTEYARAAYRVGGEPAGRFNDDGFRLARMLP